jgi:hypothetical protein
VLLEIGAVGVGDGDIVEEFGAAENEFFASCYCLSKDSQSVVGEDAEDKLVKAFHP